MHEMSIAMSIVDAVDAKARAEGAVRISLIELKIGKLAGILPEALRFCFSAAATGSLAGQAQLVIDEPDGRGRCSDCGHEFSVDFYYARCPECGSLRIVIVSGEEFLIQSIIIDEEGE
ncbi:hydrogenase maturation nickel metallochaperone HypA [Pelodictyon luteolum]|uniref:Hydrogenase maturation factor HypA n=1 Tax=Chlorobium luteolum (strain DSM 273 / BCRC 81028 / 2530) TaxID=319225 RepID=HYPA_CHLL3|nr:hydrogenase maturation nickel metallochaperone HypA [Pelodictyon luteolum]Q3B2W3.1 RecName: Full=Hydrogenase maturation factor HypA [Pelodictyon luteolum DSM 273]ABB24318.1 Hydrogenase expression/synthesis, HypA [Pelodictyon luteolum DSM 273]